MSQKRGLSPDDREFLRGGKNYAHETTEDNAWQRTRQRVRRSLLDGLFYWQYIPPEQRQQIFDIGPGEDLMWADLGDYDFADVIEQERREKALDEFEESLIALLAFLYRGLNESPDLDFDDILEDALASVANERDEIPVPGSFTPPSIETEESYDMDELRRKFMNSDESLSWMEELQFRREIEGPLEEYRTYDNDKEEVDFDVYTSTDELSEAIDEETDTE